MSANFRQGNEENNENSTLFPLITHRRRCRRIKKMRIISPIFFSLSFIHSSILSLSLSLRFFSFFSIRLFHIHSSHSYSQINSTIMGNCAVPFLASLRCSVYLLPTSPSTHPAPPVPDFTMQYSFLYSYIRETVKLCVALGEVGGLTSRLCDRDTLHEREIG